MKMVILGAGASYDSIISPELFDTEKSLWRPPLGNQLFEFRNNFNEILLRFPGARSMRSEINLCNDIEELFQKKYELSQNENGDELLLKIVNTQFYLQELFRKISFEYVGFGTSNYDILVSKAYEYYIRTGNPVLFVTFNYDTLLEKSIEQTLHIKFNSFEDYLLHPLKIIKPHGSYNWFRKFKFRPLGGATILTGELSKFLYQKANVNALRNITDLTLKDFIINEESIHPKNSLVDDGYLLFPQVLIPLKTKDEFIMPDDHLVFLEDYLDKVDELLIIGWKANEDHFHKLLKEKIKSELVNIMVVCHEDKTIESKIKDIATTVNIYNYQHHHVLNKKHLGAGTFSSLMYENSTVSKFDFFSEKGISWLKDAFPSLY